MRRKPLIGLNMDYRPADKVNPAKGEISAGYFDCLIRAQAVPVVVPPLTSRSDIERVLDTLDGFVLIGGADLDPIRDGCYRHAHTQVMHPRREDFDRMLAKLIGQRRMPVLGIGAGMQLLNVSQGGTLSLHIPDDFPAAIPHWDPQDPYHRHGLVVTKGSLIDRVYGEGEIRVASRHHMAILDLAPVFEVTARAPDGIIEAIESRDPDWFAVGVQFHPECEAASALDLRVFEEFVEGLLKRSGRQAAAVHA
ncbi:MAG: gamma-glutamyl-gamma-aminobutyrate hydrolase family protein [Thermogutta sp.]